MIIGKLKIQTPDPLTLNELVALKAKVHSFRCDKLENAMEGWEKKVLKNQNEKHQMKFDV